MSVLGKLLASKSSIVNILVASVYCFLITMIFIDPSRVALGVVSGIFLVLVVIVGLSSRNRGIIKLYVSLLVFLLFSILTYSINPDLINDRFIKALVALVAIITLSATPISEQTGRIIGRAALIALAFFFVLSFGYYDRFFSYGGMVANPNSMALATAISAISVLKARWLRARKPTNIITFITALFIILQFNSRAGAILLIGFVIFSFFLSKINRDRWKMVFLAVIAIVSIFPFAYIALSQDASYSDVEVSGKSIYSGRQLAWANGFEDATMHQILFGGQDIRFLKSLDGESFQNAYVDLLYSIGAILTILWLLLLYWCVGKNKEIPTSSYALLLAFLVYSVFESTLVSGTYHGMLMIVALAGPALRLKEGER